MRWPRLLTAVLVVVLTLPSCSTLRAPVSAPPPPLPAAAMALCPPPPAQQGNDMDALALTLKSTYDAYGACAGTHADLVHWLESQGGAK